MVRGVANTSPPTVHPQATALSLQQATLWAISACAEDPKIKGNLLADEDDTLKKVSI